jgi:3-phenylpropionate/trans-cinnamate dioxygenase ferredoxin subunit
MLKFEKRDYSLVGRAENVVGLDDDLIEDRVEGIWWSPDIPRKELKAMIPTLIKNAFENPDYHIKRPLPTPAMTDLPVEDRVNGNNGHQPTSEKMETKAGNWLEVCDIDELDEEEVIGFDYNGKKYAIYRLEGDEFYASDGLCTHENVELADGLVLDGWIECPMHNGHFEVATGKAVKAPVHVDLRMYQAERRGDKVFIEVPE